MGRAGSARKRGLPRAGRPGAAHGTFHGPRGLIRFLEAAFAAQETGGSRMHNADGSIAHVEVTELFWGDRVGRVRDPVGNIWWLQSHVADVPPDEMQARITEPAMLAAMEYVQQSLIDAPRD